MATTKITITLPDQQLAEIRKRISGRESGTVSGFIQRAVQKILDADTAFGAMVDEALMATGGPLTPKERAFARRMMTPRKPKTKRRKVA